MSENKHQSTAEIIAPGLGDIEKVRDILFGKYVVSFESRFAEFEKRLEADVDNLQQRLSEKVGRLDEMLSNSVAEFEKKVASEKLSRNAELQALNSTLLEAETGLQHSISLMEDQANQDIVKLNDALEVSRREVKDHLLNFKNQLQEQLKDQAEVLENAKLDRQELAFMLDEVAIKLRASEKLKELQD